MTSKKSIFKLSAREEREVRELAAAKRRSRLLAENQESARASRWDDLRARLDADLVLVDDVSAPWTVAAFYVAPTPTPHAPPKKTSPIQRKNIAVYGRDNFTCRDCFKEFDHPEPYNGEPIPGLTKGHIIPDAQGGPATVENLIAQCGECNQALGNNVWNPDVLTVPEWDEL